MARRKRARFFCPCCAIQFDVEHHSDGMLSVTTHGFIINPEFYPQDWEETSAKGNVRPEGISAGVDASKGGKLP